MSRTVRLETAAQIDALFYGAVDGANERFRMAARSNSDPEVMRELISRGTIYMSAAIALGIQIFLNQQITADYREEMQANRLLAERRLQKLTSE